MFHSQNRPHLVYKALTHGYRTELPLRLAGRHPFRRNMSLALRAVREDGSGIIHLNL